MMVYAQLPQELFFLKAETERGTSSRWTLLSQTTQRHTAVATRRTLTKKRWRTNTFIGMKIGYANVIMEMREKLPNTNCDEVCAHFSRQEDITARWGKCFLTTVKKNPREKTLDVRMHGHVLGFQHSRTGRQTCMFPTSFLPLVRNSLDQTNFSKEGKPHMT
uniref:Uncharacterized protein n=1 Tax=Chromera velia CCMP2878 TaxID=1169474 RepID=A0A0G4I9Y8_9ALVE|eukprot:Cvel_2058.t1-p1 / transcript=Cvel_2058.t1 / gene=Cvel_2058 / organism=Chromera_velia_CCMP2878 / gene_product=hypothetical protein / transcript_product=hypothetical protein / location=Cvel_scaffold79:62455-64647(+) / protein_length=161 / sequence_SO=supercontig / SO=protein_coding / is_pseudo=false